MKKIHLGLAIVILITTLIYSMSQQKNDHILNIGILQYVEHPSLSATRQGFVEELDKLGYRQGKNLKITYLNAGADVSNLQSMSEKLTSQNDLVFAIATPAAQSLANVSQDVPVLFSAVSDPNSAGLSTNSKTSSIIVTGTSDAAPIKQQINLLAKVVKPKSSIGLIYNSGEANSKAEATKAQKLLTESGYNVVLKTVTSTNDINQTLEALAKQVDGLFLVNDNTIASAMPLVAQISQQHHLPVIGGSQDMVQAGGLATYGLNYKELGKQTARMVIRVQAHNKKDNPIPVETAQEIQLVINQKTAKALDINPDILK
ncbi:ABC transporter substrate-binding protein [Vaginisenegalia massiliensis]|uniref:ABC transporter substrate-binding protein n=1 Tax=Vaginisenegalia massiliensis TaxID=2058294 RepID=UPI000F52C0D7|nr:ABC transporter substrate-binding protein [Vaginisenegalia massiliensis]